MLPQTTRQVLNNDGQNDALIFVSTYHGLDDIRAMASCVLCNKVLGPCRQEGAATLVTPEFGHVNTIIDTAYDQSNCNQALKLWFPTACEEIKVTACTG